MRSWTFAYFFPLRKLLKSMLSGACSRRYQMILYMVLECPSYQNPRPTSLFTFGQTRQIAPVLSHIKCQTCRTVTPVIFSKPCTSFGRSVDYVLVTLSSKPLLGRKNPTLLSLKYLNQRNQNPKFVCRSNTRDIFSNQTIHCCVLTRNRLSLWRP